LNYRPNILALAKVRFYHDKSGMDNIKSYSYLCGAPDDFGRVNWDNAIPISNWESKIAEQPEDRVNQVLFDDVPGSMNSTKELSKVEKEFANYLYQSQRDQILEHPKFKLIQQAGESEEAFRARVHHTAKERRDEEIEKMEDKYEVKLARIEEKLRREERDLDEAKSEKKGRTADELMNVAGVIFSVLGGGRRRSLSSAASKRRMARRAGEKVNEIKEDIEVLERDYEGLKVELEDKIRDIQMEWDSLAAGIKGKEIKPRKTDIKIDQILVLWYPRWI